MENRNGNGNGLFMGLLIGTVLGVGVGLLYAPRTGRETREMLRRQAADLRFRTEELGEDIKEQVGEFGSMLKERAKNVNHAIRGDGFGKVEAAQ